MPTKYNTLLLIHVFKKHLSKNWNYKKKKKKLLSPLWYFPQDHIPTFFFYFIKTHRFLFLFIFKFLVSLIPYLTYTRQKKKKRVSRTLETKKIKSLMYTRSKKKKSLIICTNSFDEASFLYYYLRSFPICGLHFFLFKNGHASLCLIKDKTKGQFEKNTTLIFTKTLSKT